MSHKEDIVKIQHNSDELQEIISNSWNAIGIINLDSQFVYVNTAFSPILGFTQEELLSIKFENLIVKKYKQSFVELVALNFEDEYKNRLRLPCIRKDGKIVTLEITISLMLNKEYFVINATDITQSVSNHEIINKYVIQTHTDLKGNLTKVSKAFCRLSGYTQEELIGQSYKVFKHPKRPASIVKALWQTIKNGQEYSGTILNKKKNGDDFWVDIVIKPIYNKYGDVTGYTAVMFDMTNEMALQDKIDENENKIKIMAETMRMVAHQWRQPLNGISLEIQNMIFDYEFEDTITAKEQESVNQLKNITKDIENLSNIINHFQNTTEVKENKVKVTAQSIIEKSIFLSNLEVSNIIIENNINIEFLTYISELSKSIAHILNNAKEAIEKVNIKNPQILIKTYKESNNNIFEIHNTGSHIPQDIIENIFNPYFSTKQERNGIGLSLYNCKAIIQLHLKGKLEVFNLQDSVMFKITLPIE
jgi:PAS domain S-box-containing protein